MEIMCAEYLRWRRRSPSGRISGTLVVLTAGSDRALRAVASMLRPA